MRRALCSLLVLLVAPPIWADDVKKTAARTFHVPYKLTSTNHVLIRVKINGKGPYNFILDTGAPALFVGTKVADKVGVKPDRDGWGKFKRIELEGGIGLEEKDGAVFVKAVLAGSPAAAAGLKAGDRVSKFQSKEVSTVAAVHRLTARLGPDEAVQVTVLREGKPHAVTITLGRGM